VANELKPFVLELVLDVAPRASKKVIEAKDFCAL
jgi:hypothetical protein